ncbi:MAG: hypothetical protein AAB602_00495 [Patescibacteria group bacterium]
MVEELIKLKSARGEFIESAFRGFGDEDEDGKIEELPLDENLDEDKTPESSSDEEEEEF